MVKRYKIGFRVDIDGQLNHLWDSRDMVMAVDYDALVSAYDQGRAFNDRASARIRALEAALREAQPWIKEDTEALEASHTPYDPNNDIDDQVRLEVDARREWLRLHCAKPGVT